MGLRKLAFGLVVTAGPLLLIACQGAPTQPPVPATAAPALRLNPPSGTTAVPAATGTLEHAPARTDAPASIRSTQPPPSLQPATTDPTGEPHVAATRPANSPGQAQSPVFYERNGLTLEYYWPLDERGNLSADETEILAYNEGGAAIEFIAPRMTFTENGSPRAQSSGTWEKYPSRFSWDRVEYISIPPSPYRGEPLLVRPGEKAKIHWHLRHPESVTSAVTGQSVALELTVVTGARTDTITQTLVRNSGQPGAGTGIDVAATPVPTRPTPTQEPQGTPPSTTVDIHGGTADAAPADAASDVRWSFDGTAWSPTGTPPDCAEPFALQTPVDMSIVTMALWPGQVRGAYVAHGGFRFDASAGNDVTVRAPAGAHLVQASQYLESGERQYLLFFSVPCGFFYRFDHVLVVSPEIAEALKDLPPASPGDSRTTYITPPLWVGQGEVVGTSVGIPPSNIFVDFGLYDVRTPNNVIPNPAWADIYAGDKEFGHFGVCFFDYLPGDHGELMRALPTGKEGKTSDYCE